MSQLTSRGLDNTSSAFVSDIIALASASGAVTTQPQSAQGAEGPLSGPDTSEKIRSGGPKVHVLDYVKYFFVGSLIG